MFGWLFFFFLIYLFEKISDTSLCYSTSLPFRIFSTLHCESFSTTCLSVSKNSSMITFHNFTNQSWNSKSIIHIILRMLLIENLIEIIDFAASKSTTSLSSIHCIGIIIGYFNLIIVVRKYFANSLTLLLLMIKQRSDSDCYFNFASTIVFMFYFGGT